jgi:hypothetical protein
MPSSPMVFELVIGAVVLGIVILFVAYLSHIWFIYDTKRWSPPSPPSPPQPQSDHSKMIDKIKL